MFMILIQFAMNEQLRSYFTGLVWNKTFLRQIQSKEIQASRSILIEKGFCLHYEESSRGGKKTALQYPLDSLSF